MTSDHLPLRLTGARVIDPATATDSVMDLWVDERGVHRSAPGGATDGVDAWPVRSLEGQVVAPALVEIHAHLREPGGELSETIATGLAAGRAGGYGHVLAMANTTPTNDDPEVTRLMFRAAAAAGTGVSLHPVSAATLGLAGAEPAPWAAQIEAGCVAVSDDGHPVADHEVLAQVLKGAASLGVRYLSHAEVPALFGGTIHDGVAGRFGLKGIPSTCESEAVEAEIALAERLGAPIHFCHLSTVGAIEALRAARARGVAATGEATPHHLVLSTEVFDERGPDPNLKMNPPLRTPDDVAAIRAAVLDGTLAAIATDHAPHAPALKAKGIAKAPFGVIGMENAFAVMHEVLVRGAGWSLPILIERLTSGPANCVGISAGRLFEGPPALAIIDPQAPWTVDPEGFVSLSRNCPVAGLSGTGRVVATLLGGRLQATHAPGRAEPHAG